MDKLDVGSISILVVDDDTVIREMLVKEMKRNFFTAFSAPDGKTALKLCAEKRVNIILLDIKLPDIDGLEVLEKAKSLLPDCEVIVLTGYGTHEVAVQALKMGAIDYLEKPVDLNDLRTALGRAQENLIANLKLDDKETILVIDDDQQIAKRLQNHFSKEGFKTFVANSGKEGLSVIENNKIDLIVTDLQLGDLTGNEVIQQAKEVYEDIEGIVVTGHKDHELAVQSLRTGAFDYINKPVDLEELNLSAEKALERIKLNRSRYYRDRELKITSQIIAKMNKELEEKIEKRTEELNQAQAQLIQTSKLATVGEMAAGLAHEINQPLAGMMLILEYLRKLKSRGKLTDEEFEVKLSELKSLSKRIDRTIKHMRTFARQDDLKLEEMNLNEPIESVLSLLLGHQLKLHEIEVVTNFSPDLPQLLGQTHQIEQVIINIISNARDAMNQKQKEISEGQPDNDYKKILKITTLYSKESNTVEAVIQDNGVGIPKKVMEKIFVPFVTTKEAGEGSGLGMSISYGIIKNHRGDLKLESKEGEGTTVRVILPAKTIEN